MQALGRLYMEHGLIRQYLENLGYALDRLERGDRPPKEFFEQTVAFAREFVDEYHLKDRPDAGFEIEVALYGPSVEISFQLLCRVAFRC